MTGITIEPYRSAAVRHWGRGRQGLNNKVGNNNVRQKTFPISEAVCRLILYHVRLHGSAQSSPLGACQLRKHMRLFMKTWRLCNMQSYRYDGSLPETPV